MAFDVNVFRAAHRPWEFTAGRRTWVARHVSARRVQQYEHAIARAKGDERKIVTALHLLLRCAFPWRFSYLVDGDPVRTILALEPAARREALADFFASLQGKTREPLPTSHSTRGTSSPSPTPTPRP